MKKIIAALLMTTSISLTGWASTESPQIDDMAEVKLDNELETSDQTQLQTDQNYVKDEAQKTEREIKLARLKAERLKNQNQRVSSEIKSKLAKVQSSKAEVQILQSKYDLIQDELKSKQSEARNLQEDLKGIRADHAQLIRKMKEMRLAIAKLDSTTRQAKAEKSRILAQMVVEGREFKKSKKKHRLAERESLRSQKLLDRAKSNRKNS